MLILTICFELWIVIQHNVRTGKFAEVTVNGEVVPEATAGRKRAEEEGGWAVVYGAAQVFFWKKKNLKTLHS